MNNLTFNIDEAIACRQLFRFDRAGNKIAPVFIYIGKPYQDDDCWACMYHITGFTEDYTFKILGIDSFQSIECVFTVIDSILVTTDDFEKGLLGWEDGSKWIPSTDYNKYSQAGSA